MDRPQISVVVATRNRPDSLRALVASLARQTLERSGFEIVIVDDCSDAPLTDLGADGLEPKVLRHDTPRGPAAARNTGWRAASAPLIAFTDDDCEASAGWLEAMLRAARQSDELIVQGRTEPIDPKRVHPLTKTMAVRGPTGLFETCNVVYPRALLERASGFDESFRHACGEDVELGWRALSIGARSEFAGDALVYHTVSQPSLRSAVAGTWKWTDGVRVIAQYPDLRVMLVGGIFWKPTHPRLILALAGFGFMSQLAPRAALLATVPYVAYYARLYRASPQRGVRSFPSHVAIDLCELVTMVAGSVRHRTLML